MIDDKHSILFKTIGFNLKTKRLALKLSQQELADKIPKMDRSKISDMENGKEDFVFSKLLNLCDALEMTLEEILKETKNHN
ncbi:helix-turn-helix domain-containing protein [Sphingobacterium faecium]|uniref:helix-turn-helix domain-containing protein n=1 Tax=Sphingobacterium faecium TaxID=34087 RepID=UPI0024797AD4|nr:helix-turn-helix transcriptional regulator [Sphingobacterium faecium]WGQ13790.1 helix-turn-helix transcriptional regulator [Sphingobacterium faecium]